MYQQPLLEKPRWGVKAVSVTRSIRFAGKPSLPQDFTDLLKISISLLCQKRH